MKQNKCCNCECELHDHKNTPIAINIDKLTKENPFFRTSLWTGENLQLTLMSIKVGEDIGVEIHENTDQFIRIESGCAVVKMGKEKNQLTYIRKVDSNYAILVPAGTWHNIINSGNTTLKLYSIYAPPHHPFGTVNVTKQESI